MVWISVISLVAFLVAGLTYSVWTGQGRSESVKNFGRYFLEASTCSLAALLAVGIFWGITNAWYTLSDAVVIPLWAVLTCLMSYLRLKSLI